MDRELFRKKMQDKVSIMTEPDAKEVIRTMTFYMDAKPSLMYHGSKNILISVEECNELISEIANILEITDSLDNAKPNADVLYGLLEESADAIISCETVMAVFDLEPIQASLQHTLSAQTIVPTLIKLTYQLSHMSQLLCKSLRSRPSRQDCAKMRKYAESIVLDIISVLAYYDFEYDDMMHARSIKLQRLKNNMENDPTYR